MKYLVSFVLLSLVSLATSPRLKAETYTIAAAASLRNALDAMKPELDKIAAKDNVQFTFGASGALKAQIIEGAPIDLFLSASSKPMDALVDARAIEASSRTRLLQNEVVWIAPKTLSLKGTSLSDLKDPKIKRIALGEVRSVPAGEYALQVLQHEKIAKDLEPKFLFAKDVRQVLTWVEQGEVEVGFVYKTDWLEGDKSKIQLLGTAAVGSHETIVYEMAAVKAKAPSPLREKTILALGNYLKSPEAQKIWTRFGFEISDPIAMEKALRRAPH